MAVFLSLRCQRWVQIRLNFSQLISRHSSTSLEEKALDECRIPMVPKRRNPNAVLEALALTMEPVEHEKFRGIGPADPLYPGNKVMKMEYIRQREAGKKAARYVMYRWPNSFRFKKLDSDPVTVEKKPLERNIAKRRPYKAMWIYNKMKENGEEVSLDTKNDLLALVSYYALGSPYTKLKNMEKLMASYKNLASLPQIEILKKIQGVRREQVQDTDLTGHEKVQDVECIAQEQIQDIDSIGQEQVQDMESTGEEQVQDTDSLRLEQSWDMKTISEGEVGDTNEDILKIPLNKKWSRGSFRVWTANNVPEQLFNEILDKNGATYEALIQGLVNHQYYRRAFQMFDEMRSKGFQAHTQTYNLLLTALSDLKSEESWKKAMLLLKHMNTDPMAVPNTNTFNLMLEIAASNKSAVELSGRVMREMFHVGVEPTLTTFFLLLRTHSVRGEAFVIKEIVDYLKDNPQIVNLQDAHCHEFFGEGMSACVALKDPSTAMKLKKVSEKSSNRDLVDKFHTFVSKYLQVLCGGSGPIDVLIQEYNRIVPREFIPFEWLYGIMFKACAEAENIDFAMHLWEDLLKYREGIKSASTAFHLCSVIKTATRPDSEHLQAYTDIVEKVLDMLKEANEIPSPLIVPIVNTLMKLAYTTRNVEKIWEYYDRWFKAFGILPSFETLSLMLRAHYKSPDKASLIWIMEEMIERHMHLPQNFVIDMCEQSNIDKDTTEGLSRRFAENHRRSQQVKTVTQE